MEPLAKPSGIRLSDHRAHVLAEAERLLNLRPAEAEGLPFLALKYARLTGGTDLAARVKRAAWYHDWGKEHNLWQSACQEDYKTYQAWREDRGLDPDAVDADDYERFRQDTEWRHNSKSSGQHLMRSGIRHEFESLRLCEADPSVELSLAERAAIAAHHGKLSARARIEERWRTDDRGAFAGIWQRFQNAMTRVARADIGNGVQPMLLRRYEVAGVRALLRLADSRASRAEGGGALAPIEPFRYRWPLHWSRRPVQDIALQHADAPVSILRAPTGSGKTGAALLWGRHQIDKGRADRLVVAMPTRFTANALAGGASERIAETGLYHSSAWHVRYGDLDREDPAYDLARERHALARSLATPLTVCTVDHLLLALTGTREDHHAAFFFLANAAVVFDEVDFYDGFVQANLGVLLDALRALGVPMLLMSATVPDSARTLYDVPDPIRETRAESSGRRLLHRHVPIEQPEDADEVLRQMIASGTGIVYANTVERAYRYWTHLREHAGDLPVFLYHSRFTEPDKKVVEEAIVEALGERAWQAGTAHGIAVLTQIGEMSVNISTPLMLSDLCPWDRLAQRAGRLARFAHEIPAGEVWVSDPHRDGALYPAPYGHFENGWTAGEPLLATQSSLNRLTTDGPLALTAQRFVDEVDRLYPEPDALTARAAGNADELRKMVRENWLVLPAGAAREDEADLPGRWKSRDIPPQKTLLILDAERVPKERPLRLFSYSAWHGLIAECGIAMPHYMMKRAVDRGWASRLEIQIGRGDEYEYAFWSDRSGKYDAPEAKGRRKGIGSGIAELSLREHEDSFSNVCL